MKKYHQAEIEILISNAAKPKPISNYGYPLNNLDDRLFEILTYSIFKKKIQFDKTLKKRFDDIVLMQGVGEKGIDCAFIKKDKITSIIQCKKLRSNISDNIIISELIKFALHTLNNPNDFNFDNKFTYYLATSTGLTGKAILLPNSLNNGNFLKNYDLETITNNVIKKFKEFKLFTFQEIKQSLIKRLQSFSYEFIRPEDYNLWINDFPNLIETFFEVKKVTDNKFIDEKSKEIINVIKELFIGKDVEEVRNFIDGYKNIAKDKLNIVNFIGFDIQKHRHRPNYILLTDLFVQPSFQQRINEKNEKVYSVVNKELKIPNLFKSEKNIIILGDPGAGKSLLVKFLIVSLITNQSEKLGLKHLANHLPIRIELRKYNEVKDTKNITDFFVETLNREFQTKISLQQFDKLLEGTPSLVFFDGLDEVFNISHKARIKDDIEAFSTKYQNAKCIVTSRFIGYHDIKFNQRKFDEFAILRFNDFQIKDLVTKFYSALKSSTQEKRNRAIDGCIKQLNEDVDDELKSNPLILTLILILTSNNIIIPDSKLEIYESCTKTLVDSIDDKEKELNIELPVKNKNLTFSQLAYWQYECLSKNVEISNAKAVKTLADFLLSRKEAIDFSEAEDKAEKFLEYAERRSVYFENNFTHKTFLEYFTAEYLYSTCIAKASDEGRRKLIDVSKKYLSSSFWYIVFELLFTRIDRVQPDNELLDEIFGKHIESHSLDVFYFLISNLNRLSNISNDIKSRIIERTILLCIKGEKMKAEIRRGFRFDENSILFKISLLRTNKESNKLLQDILIKLEFDGLSEKQEVELYNLYFELHSFDYKLPSLEKLEIKNKKRLKELANTDLLLFSKLYLSRESRGEKIDINVLLNQIENFGHKSLFNHIPLRHIEGQRRIDTFDMYLMNVLESSDFESFKLDLQKLINHGLKEEMIINHVIDTRLLYFTRSRGLEKILKLYIKSDDKLVDEILEKIIRKDNDMKIAYEKFKSEKPHPKLKKIDKLFDRNILKN